MILSREQRRQLERDNAKLPLALQEVPRDEWPDGNHPQLRVLRSRRFLVQEFPEDDPVLVRLSVNRTTVSGDRWADEISWDELQKIKSECGYRNFDAVEIYPADADVVNVANMRHLWVMRNGLEFAWRHQ